MLQCKDCEFFSHEPNGRILFRCDPFNTIKEPECLQKWQLLKIDALFQCYQTTLRWYQKLAPMQEEMFKYMKREMDDINEAEKWKIEEEPPEEPDNDRLV